MQLDFNMLAPLIFIGVLHVFVTYASAFQTYNNCPAEQEILPCQCKNRGGSVLLSCRRSTLEELSIIFAILSQRVSLVEELMLENNDINELPSNALGSLSVHRLLLWNNGIERIDGDSFHGLSDHLIELHIREPRLDQFASNALEELSALTDLVVEYTPLNQLPSLRHCGALRSLHIDGSFLKELDADALHNLPLLKTVHITNSLVQLLADGSLSHLQHLENVNFTGNRLTTLHKKSMIDLPRLKIIDLRSNLLDDINAVVSSLKEFHTLQEIHLDNNRLEHLDAAFVFPALVSLSVSHNDVASVAASFEHLPALRHLDLSFNSITAWPTSLFASISTLHDLNVAGNPVGSVVMDMHRIMGQLPQLRSLNLDNCGFHTISQDTIGAHSTLEHLSLRNNSMKKMDAGCFHRLPSLIVLNLSHNKLTNKPRDPRSHDPNPPLADLSGVFWNLPSLQSLDLSDNEIGTVDSDFFTALTSLRFLNLSRNQLNAVDYRNLMQTPNVDVLDLSHNSLNNIDHAICRYLPNLEKIDISFNNVAVISRGISSCWKLRSLDLSHNRISRLAENSFAGSIQSIDLSHNQLLSIPRVERLNRLKWFSLAANQIHQLSTEDLQQNGQLEMVDLSQNGIEQLPRMFFSENGRLRHIDLSHNSITVLPAHVFHNLATLDKLDLSFNRLSELMAEVFDPSTSLRYLDLSNNDITHLSTDGIQLDGVQILDLKHNRIEDLSDFTVRSLPSLSELDLSHNVITSVQARSFENSKALIKLDLSDNLIETVPSNSFGALPNLQVLRLARNRIERIEEKAFFDLVSLEDLSLEENVIERIDTDAFHGPIFLRTLNLSTNALDRIEDAGVRNLLSLEVLDLSFNRINEIDSRSLRRLSRLLQLKMDNNSLCHLPEGFLSNQRRLQSLSLRNNRLYALRERSVQHQELVHLDIGGNPLQCDCQLAWLLELLQSNRSTSLVSAGDDVACYFPSEEEAVALESVRPSRLLCQSRSESQTEINHCSRYLQEDEMITTTSDTPELFDPPSPLTEDQILNAAELDDGDTQTIYAGIRNPGVVAQSSSEQQEKTSAVTKESLMSMVLPSLKLGLNFLPAIISVGSLMTELLRKQSQQKEDHRKNQKPGSSSLHLFNPPQEKPNRGPDYHHIPWLIPFGEPSPPAPSGALPVKPSVVPPTVAPVSPQVVPSVKRPMIPLIVPSAPTPAVPPAATSAVPSMVAPVPPQVIPSVKRPMIPLIVPSAPIPAVPPAAASVVPPMVSPIVHSSLPPVVPTVVPQVAPFAVLPAAPTVVSPVATSIVKMNNHQLKDNAADGANRYVPVNYYPPAGAVTNSMGHPPMTLDTSKWSPAFAVPSVHPVIHPLLANKEHNQKLSNSPRGDKPTAVTTDGPVTPRPPPSITEESISADYQMDYDEYYANASTEQLLNLLREQRANTEQNLWTADQLGDDSSTAGSSDPVGRQPIRFADAQMRVKAAKTSSTSNPLIEEASTESPLKILWYEHQPEARGVPSIGNEDTRFETIKVEVAHSTSMTLRSSWSTFTCYLLLTLFNYF